MFEDVPDELSRMLREAPPEFREPNLYQFFAATAVNGFYLQQFFGSSEAEFLKFPQHRAGHRLSKPTPRPASPIFLGPCSSPTA